MFFVIRETLVEVTLGEMKNSKEQYVAVLSRLEWEKNKEKFDMGIDLEIEEKDIFTT